MPRGHAFALAVLASLTLAAPAARAAKPVRGALYTGSSATLGAISFSVSRDGERVSNVTGRELALRCPRGGQAPPENLDSPDFSEPIAIRRDGTFRAVLNTDTGPYSSVTGRFGPGGTVTGRVRFEDSTRCVGSTTYSGTVAKRAGGTARRVFTLSGIGATDIFDLPGGAIGLGRSENEGRVFLYTLDRLDADGGERQFADLSDNSPGDVVGLPDGTVTYTLPYSGCIRSRSPAGRLSTIAGRCDADQATLVPVKLVALDGGAYVFSEGGQTGADEDTTRLVRREPDGRLTPLAPVSGVEGLAAEPGGSVLVSTQNRILRVSPTGTVTAVAGTGAVRFSGDGGPATTAGMAPGEVAALPGGGFLFVDRSVARIRQVDAAGRVTTFAGGGEAGTGAPGRTASLPAPFSVDVFRDGTVAVRDDHGVDLFPGPDSKRLLVGLPSPARAYRSAVRAHKTVPIVLTRRARVRLTVTRGGRTVARVSRTLGAGTGRIRIPRGARLRGKGSLRLRVDARAGRAGATARLVL